jgi:solute:Na+ symporter, SSS family
VVAGVEKLYGIIIAAVVVTLYFSAGGIKSAAIVNIIELIVILLGFCVATPFALQYVGGWEGLHTAVAAHMDTAATARYFSWDGMGSTAILGYFLMLTPAFCISPGLIGKVYAARDEKAVRRGTLWNGIVQLLFAFLPTIIGMCAFAAFPELGNQELALPKAMKEMMPFGISALALAAIFAAEVSTCDTVLYMLATSLSKDLYQTFFRPDLDDGGPFESEPEAHRGLRRRGRIHRLLYGQHHYGPGHFLQLDDRVPGGPLPVRPVPGEASTKGAFCSAIIGVAVVLGLKIFNGGKGIGILNATSLGILVAAVIMLASLWVVPKKEK